MENNKIDVMKLRDDFKIQKDDVNKTYYFKCDEKYKDTLIEKGFELTVLPHQWWGNIINPKVVVLALNPGYSAGADELDSILFGNLIEKNYNSDDYYQFLFGDECGNSEFSKNGEKISFKYSSVSCWWRKVFDKILPDDLKDGTNNLIKSFNKNVAFFNLVGYQSKDTSDLYTKAESTQLIVKYVNYLANNPDRLFIFVWGEG